MANKFGKKSLLFFVLILALIVTTIGVATAETENVIEEVKLVSDSEVVVCSGTTLSGATNTVNTSGPVPQIEAKINGDWVSIPSTSFTWTGSGWPVATANVRSDGAVAFTNHGGHRETSRIVTGTLKENSALTVSYTVYPSSPLASKADIEILTNLTNSPNDWNGNYALVNDIDYMSANWHERYLKPIAISKYHHTAGTFAGIFGDVPSYNGSQLFYGRIDGQGYSIKNAVLALGAAFKGDEGMGITGYGQNWIQNMAGTLKNIKFENLTYESAAQALANPYMYTVATNPALQGRYVDADSNGLADNVAYTSPFTGNKVADFPVITENGVVTAIDINKLQKDRTWGSETVKSTLAQGVGLIGALNGGTIDNVYVEANIHSASMYFNNATIAAHSGVLVGDIYSGKIKNSVIVPTLTEGIFSSASGGGSTVAARDNYYKYIGGIAGLNRSTDSDNIENCALVLESGSGLKSLNAFNAYVGIQVYGGRFYNSPAGGAGGPYNADTINTAGLKNVKIYEGANAMKNYLADADMASAKAVQAKYEYWQMASVSASVFQGEYDGAQGTAIIFGNVDTDMFAEADIEIGVRLTRKGVTYEFKFNDEGDKALREDGAFGMALKELAVGDWTGYVYAKLSDGTEIKSDAIAFSVASAE